MDPLNNEIKLLEGYIFTDEDENGNIINATKIVLEKKEKEHQHTPMPLNGQGKRL